MPLKIVKSSDPIHVDRINVALYGPPGVGKSSLAFTADEPLLLDFDQGAHRAVNRRDSVRVASWSDVAHISEADLAPYKTVVVDTAGRALDLLSADIIFRNPKAGRGGALTLQGYGALKTEFVAWLKLINTFGKDVVLIAHMDEQRNGDDIIERLDVQGGSKGEIYKAADAMGRVVIRGGKRWLMFSPTDASFGKNPAQIEPIEIPHPDKDPHFLGTVITQIKDKLNAMTQEQLEAQQALEEWRSKIEQFNTPKAFNDQLEDVKRQSQTIQALFAHTAKARGYVFEKSAGQYMQQLSQGPKEKAA